MAKDIFDEDVFENVVSKDQEKRKQNRQGKIEKKEKKKARKKAASEGLKSASKVLVIVVIVLLAVLVLVGKNISQIIELSKQLDEANETYDSLVKQIEDLQNELERVNSPEYIEEQARNQLHMIMPGETQYRYIEK